MSAHGLGWIHASERVRLLRDGAGDLPLDRQGYTVTGRLWQIAAVTARGTGVAWAPPKKTQRRAVSPEW